MPGRKKKFIDKKSAVTFHVVHRSQHDPLQADDTAPEHVLVPESSKDNLHRKDEQLKYGIYFDDDYNYLQHLRDVSELTDDVEIAESFVITNNKVKPTSEISKLTLPSSVFGSGVETEIGLLNKATPLRGPQIDWDPDIVAAMDEDFDFDNPDNQLADDFVTNALCADQESNGDDNEYVEDSNNDSESLSDNSNLCPENFYSDDLEETKSRFTNYSMTSSVIRRNEGLSMIDKRFEQIYAEYDETEMGALEHEDITGGSRGIVDSEGKSDLLELMIQDFHKYQTKIGLDDIRENETSNVDVNTQDLSESDDEGSSGNESDGDCLVKIKVRDDPVDKWDCESILSTYSSLYNHPKIIDYPKAIQLTKNMQIPDDVLRTRLIETGKETRLQREQPNTYRPENETPEERRERKKAIKQERKIRREEKKSTKTAFKAETLRQEREKINVQRNIQSLKIT